MKTKAATAISLVAALVLVVPVAGAAMRPDDRGGARGPGAVSADHAFRAAIRDAGSGAVRPDDRPGRREVPIEAASLVPAPTADGFDWTDAGVGAGVVAAGGVLMLILTGILLGRHDRRRLGHA